MEDNKTERKFELLFAGVSDNNKAKIRKVKKEREEEHANTPQ